MNHIIKYKLFENNNNITAYDVAWLYFLKYPYNGKMDIKSWEKDNRMNGQNCDESFRKFECVEITDKHYLAKDGCSKIIDDYFGAKTFEDVMKKGDEFETPKKSSVWDSNYPLNKIPLELFLRKNPAIDKAFDSIRERIRLHFNSQRSDSRILSQLSKSRRIKEYNFMKWYYSGLPEKFLVYRGIKNEYNEKFNREYSCWTTNIKQAERFAKYRFSGYMQFEPIEASTQTILVAEINISDVKIFIGGDEREVILKEPVEIKEIRRIK